MLKRPSSYMKGANAPSSSRISPSSFSSRKLRASRNARQPDPVSPTPKMRTPGVVVGGGPRRRCCCAASWPCRVSSAATQLTGIIIKAHSDKTEAAWTKFLVMSVIVCFAVGGVVVVKLCFSARPCVDGGIIIHSVDLVRCGLPDSR